MPKIYYYLAAPYKDGVTSKQVSDLKLNNKSIKDAIKDKEVAVTLHLYFGQGIQRKFQIPLYIKPCYWDASKQEAKASLPGCKEFNQTLTRQKSIIYDIESTLRSEDPNCSPDKITDSVKTLICGKKQDVQIHFDVAFDQFLEDRKKTWSVNTYNKYRSLKKTIISFYTSKGKSQLLLRDIDYQFCNSLKNYFLDKKHVNATIDKNLDGLRIFMDWCKKSKYTFVSDLGIEKTGNGQEHAVLTLSEEEIKALEELDLSLNPKLQRVRNLFCFQIYTGQRFSDLIALQWSDIQDCNGGKLWTLFQKKTKSTIPVRIPIDAKGINILNDLCESRSLTGFVFKVISNVKYNLYLKELAVLAGINSMVKVVSYSGSVKNESIVPKHELVCSHTARRTMITRSLQKGASPTIVMAISGHKDYKSFKKYIGQFSNDTLFDAIK